MNILSCAEGSHCISPNKTHYHLVCITLMMYDAYMYTDVYKTARADHHRLQHAHTFYICNTTTLLLLLRFIVFIIFIIQVHNYYYLPLLLLLHIKRSHTGAGHDRVQTNTQLCRTASALSRYEHYFHLVIRRWQVAFYLVHAICEM